MSDSDGRSKKSPEIVSSRGQSKFSSEGNTVSPGGYRLAARPYPTWALRQNVEKKERVLPLRRQVTVSTEASSRPSRFTSRVSEDMPIFRIPKVIERDEEESEDGRRSSGGRRSSDRDDSNRGIAVTTATPSGRNGSNMNSNSTGRSDTSTNTTATTSIDTTTRTVTSGTTLTPATSNLKTIFDSSPKSKSPPIFSPTSSLLKLEQYDIQPTHLTDDNPNPQHTFIFPKKPQPSFTNYLQPHIQPQYQSHYQPFPPQFDKSSRWQQFISLSSRPEFYESHYVDEKYLDTGYLDTIWKRRIEEEKEAKLRKQLNDQKSTLSTFKNLFIKSPRTPQTQEHPNTISPARYFVSEESRKTWKPTLIRTFLNNALIPLTLRAIIFILSVIALAISCSIYVRSLNAQPAPITQQPSTIMAIVVQSTAIVYLAYITYDEYSSKPLGLRDAKAKMRLIMLDLLFIIFSAANLSLTFNTLFDRTWVCQTFTIVGDSSISLPYIPNVCRLQRGLACFLFMVLVMWVLTFTISIFRLVERVAQ